MRSGVLCGRDHVRLGAIEAVAEGRVAIAISLGGAAKAYPHTDPNEDAALFAEGPGGVLLAVADGHAGCNASEAAVELLLEDRASAWTGDAPLDEDDWPEHALHALAELDAAVVAHARRAGRKAARTTLSLAVVRPAQDRALLASLGDSHIFEVRAALAASRTAAGDGCEPSYFLGREAKDAQRLGERAILDSVRLSELRALVLATDGLTEIGLGVDDPEDSVFRAVESARREPPARRPLAAARAVAQAALDAHARHRSGDNVATAVWWGDD